MKFGFGARKTAENDSSSTQKRPRIEWIDSFRGLAVLLMIVYHFFYDLSYFGWYDADVGGRSEWLPFRYLILTMFISLMAISLYRVHSDRLRLDKYAHWLIRVAGASLIVSVGTSFMFPHSWVYFGVLHFMTVASIFVLLLRNYRIINFIIGWVMIVVYNLDLLPFGWPVNLIRHIFHDGKSVDYVSIFPWLGVALIASSLSQKLFSLNVLNRIGARFPGFVQFLGRHSLPVYLIHQPILFGILYAYKFLVVD